MVRVETLFSNVDERTLCKGVEIEKPSLKRKNEIIDYINEHKNEKNGYEKLYEYFDKQSDDVLLVGIKINRVEK